MSKINRATFIQFGVNVNAAADICEFGTPASGSPVYTTSIPTLQSNAAWTTGWAAETISSNRPFLEDMNATHYVFSYMLAYLMQMGIPEYDSGTTYFINSIVQYSGILYQVTNDGSGTGISGYVPTNATYWRVFTAPAPYIKVSNTQTSGTNGGAASTGSWQTMPLNSKDNDTASIATLSTNQITLPAGTYLVRASSPFVQVGNAQIRLYNQTASAVLVNGQTVFMYTSNSGNCATLEGQFTLSASSNLVLQYQVGTHVNTADLGEAGGYGPEVYAMVTFTKIS